MVCLGEVLMKSVCTVLILFALTMPSLAAVSGPNDRQATDPKSVHSKSNLSARPIEVEDLFGTRLIDAAALSPDGEEIAITTNLSGRSNLWTTTSAGSWPVQMVRSDDRQEEPVWSPDGRWIAFSQ